MIKDIHSTGLNVQDLDAAIAFYCTEDAFELVERFDIENSEQSQNAYELKNSAARGALLRGHAGFLELTEFEDTLAPEADNRGVYEAGLRHICIRTKDVHSFFDNLAEAGSGWHARPAGLGTGLDYAYVRDPEGNLLELEGLPMLPEGVMKPWFDHAAIVSTDIDRLAAFYEMLTQGERTHQESYGPEAKFDKVAGLDDIVFDGAWVVFGISRIEMWRYRSPATNKKQPPAANEIGWSHLCFEVDDIDAEHARLSEAGVEFTGEIQKTPFGRSVFLRDVDGNLVRLLEVADSRPELSVENLKSRPFLKQIRDVSESMRKGRQQ